MSQSSRYFQLSDDNLGRIDSVCKSFERYFQSETPERIEECLTRVPAELRETLFRELVAIEIEQHSQSEYPDVARAVVPVPSECRFLAVSPNKQQIAIYDYSYDKVFLFDPIANQLGPVLNTQGANLEYVVYHPDGQQNRRPVS